jgi:hypothetical protein
MTDDELREMASAAIEWSAASGVEPAGFQLVIGRECSGPRARVAPGLMAEVVCCEAKGTRVALDAREVIAWLDVRAAHRATVTR